MGGGGGGRNHESDMRLCCYRYLVVALSWVHKQVWSCLFKLGSLYQERERDAFTKAHATNFICRGCNYNHLIHSLKRRVINGHHKLPEHEVTPCNDPFFG